MLWLGAVFSSCGEIVGEDCCLRFKAVGENAVTDKMLLLGTSVKALLLDRPLDGRDARIVKMAGF